MTLLFIHIPKTGGTSLRLAALKALGAQALFDYGKEAPEATSPAVMDMVYGGNETGPNRYARLADHVRANGIELLMGHFPASRYAAFFSAENFATIVREPVARIVSHYNYWAGRGVISEPFETFIEHATFHDYQWSFLDGVAPAELGFVGLTERYDDSLACLNGIWGLDIRPRRSNATGFLRRKVRAERLDDATLRRLRELNPKDFALYDQAVAGFPVRICG